MNRNNFLLELDELLELPKGTLKEDQILDKLPEWDSLAVISFIALADATYKVNLDPKQLASCKTIGDLAVQIEEREKNRT